MLGIAELAHVAGAGELPLRIAPEKMLVFFESLPYTGLEIGTVFFSSMALQDIAIAKIEDLPYFNTLNVSHLNQVYQYENNIL